MKSGRSKAFFKLFFFLRLRLSRKPKIKSFGEKGGKIHTLKHNILPQPEHESPAHSFPTPGLSVCLSVSLLFSLPHPPNQGIHRRVKNTPSQSPRGLCYQSQDADQQPLRSGSPLPHLQEEGFAVCQALRNCLPQIKYRERKMNRLKITKFCIQIRPESTKRKHQKALRDFTMHISSLKALRDP